MRIALVWLFVIALALHAFRDWYKSLCGLILLMAVFQHPDMPRSVFGIPGFNPWNLLMAGVLLGWLANRRRERLVWDMPGHVSVLLVLYFAILIVSFLRMMADRESLPEPIRFLVNEHLVNVLKWVIPGLLLFDGCRDRSRLVLGLAATLGVCFLLSAQVIRWVPAAGLSGGELQHKAAKLIQNEVGYNRVNMSALLAGASWAILAARGLCSSSAARLLVPLAAASVVYGQALTGGRMGQVGWLCVGLAVAALRWRRILPLIPLVPLAVALVIPGAAERMLQGIEGPEQELEQGRGDDEGVDAYEMTSGRTLIWPYVIDQIGEAPLLGHGKLAMGRTGVSATLWETLGESFPHPHNAYLELLLDAGWVGLALVVPFYLVVLLKAASLFHDGRSPLFVATGGAALTLVLALLIAALGSQTFYPREGAVGMWCAIGLMLRVWVERPYMLAASRAAPPASRAQRVA